MTSANKPATPRKRNCDDLDSIKNILLDIEGTTTPISFVKDILFPYIRSNIGDYLEKHWEDEQCQKDVQSLREQSIQDSKEGKTSKRSNANKEEKQSKDQDEQTASTDVPVILLDGDASSIRQTVVDYVFFLMDADKKVTSLKQLQGHMWKNAYSTGKVVGKIYKDVLPSIKQWINGGKQVYIYSSGSVEAQKLLFGHTEYGNILEFISGHFDTNIGAKVETESYCKIAKEIKCETKEILFLTDVTREARPAKEAGCQVAVVIRAGNAALSDAELQEFSHITSFTKLFPQGKKTKEISS